MNLTKEERLMYEVMKAIYDSGIPISFKGSMVLKACLIESGYYEDTRHTVDIDANWYSATPPSADKMTKSLQEALNDNDINLNVDMYRMYGEGRSAGFEVKDSSTGEIIFTMDIDVNRPEVPSKLYEVDGLSFNGVVLLQMISDKLSVVSSDKVFRRIKDVVDLYYTSKTIAFDEDGITQALEASERNLGDFDGFLNRRNNLRHAYDKFRFAGDVHKPPFDEVYQAVTEYISPILPAN